MLTPDPSVPSATTMAEDTAPHATSSFDSTGQPAEFEFVLGRRQVASVALVGVTLLALFTVGAYIAGKSTGTVHEVVVEAASPLAATEPTETDAIAPSANPAPADDATLYGELEKGQAYVQMGHVGRGFAAVMVHGARRLGFPAFLAPGNSQDVYRVLAGPFKNDQEVQRAQSAFAAIGLDTFVRRYEDMAEPQASAAPAPPPAAATATSSAALPPLN